MASLCSRCALRIHRAAATESASLLRPFSSTNSRPAHAIPQFTETSNAELDDVLATMRNKHFIPAALSPAQRRLIFGHSKRDELTANPQSVEIAGETIELKWMDRRAEIPKRTKLFKEAVRLMAEDGSYEAWRNLAQLLIGLKRSGVEVKKDEMERLMRIAINNGHFEAILQCLRRGDETAMTLTRPEVLDAVLLGIRQQGQKDDWSAESLEKAIAQGRDVAQLLEMKMHGGGKVMKPDDLRRDPRVIGVYLELSAVFAARHQGGKDADGRVKAYAERLLYNLEGAKEMSTTEPVKRGTQPEMLLTMSIWHGLKLAQKILAMDMPNPMLAEEVRSNYEIGLKALVRNLEAQNPNPPAAGYVGQALTAWRECTQD